MKCLENESFAKDRQRSDRPGDGHEADEPT